MNSKTPIAILQEHMVAINQPLPVYTFDSAGNLLEPKFLCSVKAGSITASGEAKNKKDAKQKAAENALIEIGLKVSIHRDNVDNTSESSTPICETIPKDFIASKNYVGILNEFASGHGMPYPLYDHPIAIQQQMVCICNFQGMETEGYGSNKKAAKQLAAYNMTLNLSSISQEPAILSNGNQGKTVLEDTANDRLIIKKYEEITSTTTKLPQLVSFDTVSNVDDDIKKENLVIKQTKFNTCEEAMDEFARLEVQYELKQLHADPFVMVLEIASKNMTLIGKGEDKDVAMLSALNQALEILEARTDEPVPPTSD